MQIIFKIFMSRYAHFDEILVLWIGFRHTGPISLCVDLFVFIYVYFECFCFVLHTCIIESTMGWT